MKRQPMKKLAALMIAILFALSPLTGVLAADGGNAVIQDKTEVIYATLDAGGAVKGVYAVNQFDIARPGSVFDYGQYDFVLNLTDTRPLKLTNGRVDFEADKGKFYYQGNMGAARLPWDINIAYTLDGVPIAPQELSGKSGAIGITLTTTPNEAADPVFYEHYLLQITFTLDTQTCTDIAAADATIASAGANTAVVYTVMPKKNADIHITAQVQNFFMQGIDITALPFSMDVDLPDTDEMVDDFRSLADAISELNEGVGELADGTGELSSGADELSDGSGEILNGLNELTDNADDLADGSSKILDALNEVAGSLNGDTGEMDLSALIQLPAVLSQLSQGLKEISGGITSLAQEYSSAYAALDGAMDDMPGSISQSQIQDLYNNCSETSLRTTIDALVESYSAAQTAKGTYNTVKPAFAAIVPTLTEFAGSINTIAGTLSDMSAQIAASLSSMDMLDQIEQLKDGMAELASQYAVFHRGLKKYLNGVAELSSGYEEFDSGLLDFNEGIGDLKSGIYELYDGTNELDEEVSDMPDTVQTEIDDMLADYTETDFEPVSFASPNNQNIKLVQFIIKTDGIEKPEKPATEEPAEQPLTIWDRFLALFRPKED